MNVTIESKTFLGTRHGLETVSQLLVFDSLSGSIVAPSQVCITDKPAYTHRGLALDTARNYIPVTYILSTLDAMASVKLNTLHWHITDSHSFPFVSKHYPKFSEYGAYSPEKVSCVWELIACKFLNFVKVVSYVANALRFYHITSIIAVNESHMSVMLDI